VLPLQYNIDALLETVMTLMATDIGRITPEEFLRIPDSNSMELVDGQIVEKAVGTLSSETEATFIFPITAFLRQNAGMGRVFASSLGYRCFPDDPDKIRKPDVTVIRAERLAALPDPDPGYMPIVPDLAVEVVSTNDTVYELDEKVEEYLAAGFPLVWVADPEARRVTVHPRGGKPYLLTAEDDIDAPSVLPGFKCKVADLFPLPQK